MNLLHLSRTGVRPSGLVLSKGPPQKKRLLNSRELFLDPYVYTRYSLNGNEKPANL
jgi:hypothetical protein